MNKARPIRSDFNIENARPPYRDYSYFSGVRDYPFRPKATVFDLVNAWWLVESATLAYAEPEFARPRFAAAGMDQVEFISNGGTQVYLAHNTEFTIVAFRGTETRARNEGTLHVDFSEVLADIVSDVQVKLMTSEFGGKVHQGFEKALDYVFKELAERLTELTVEGRKLWFTGHSLGAALATLAADRFGNVSGLYTFGSPRVGDDSFKGDFGIPTYRFVNNNDVVARVPPPPLYAHVGELKYIDHEGRIHDNVAQLERLVDRIEGRMATFFDPAGRLRLGFRAALPDGINDHIPILYATHIWNSLP